MSLVTVSALRTRLAPEAAKLADLIMLDRNLFENDPHDIYKAKVMITIMDGKVRYRDRI